ncbi:MAG: hypothetical protein OMM_14071 [Candidatus Magnetoglobus multicellularis str. Araruama]|uniref:Uncharacterized protein n=1 Tax=Candidatus Magnetoglobus multicellularis str. Araruama TaxID=890399 RepID=A0A1V1NSL2_9BACT|nr:MAG: hypothetical protein OMM_14071 [Candidatus Magnetoglobus multicellularis str. Araruama]
MIVFVFVLSTTGYAKMHGLLPHGKWWHMPDVVKALKITEEEKTILDRTFLENRKAMITLKGEMSTKKLDMETLMESDPFDESGTLTQFESIQATGQKMWKTKVDFLIEVRKLLGKDRFMQLKSQFKRHHRGKHRKGPKRHHRGGKGHGQMSWDE